MEKMDKVEALRSKAGVSYEDAKNALENNNWDVLEAMIALEKEGKVNMSSYSTKTETLSGDVVTEKGDKNSEETKGKKFLNWCADIFEKANRNSLEIIKEGKTIISVPVSLFVVLVLFAFWVVVPLMIVGLFFSMQYHFVGPDVHSVDVDINAAMDSVSKTAENLKSEFTSKDNKEE